MGKNAERLVLNFSIPLFKFEAKPSQEVALSDHDHSLLRTDNEWLYRCYSGQLQDPGETQPRAGENTHFKATTKWVLWLANSLRTEAMALDTRGKAQQMRKGWMEQELWSSKL